MNNDKPKQTHSYGVKIIKCHGCSGCGLGSTGRFSESSGTFEITKFDKRVRIPTKFISPDGFVADWFVERLSERRTR